MEREWLAVMNGKKTVTNGWHLFLLIRVFPVMFGFAMAHIFSETHFSIDGLTTVISNHNGIVFSSFQETLVCPVWHDVERGHRTLLHRSTKTKARLECIYRSQRQDQTGFLTKYHRTQRPRLNKETSRGCSLQLVAFLHKTLQGQLHSFGFPILPQPQPQPQPPWLPLL